MRHLTQNIFTLHFFDIVLFFLLYFVNIAIWFCRNEKINRSWHSRYLLACSFAHTLVRRRFINFLRCRVDVTERVVTEFRRVFHERIAFAYRARFPSMDIFPFVNSTICGHIPLLVAFSMTAAVTTFSCVLFPFFSPSLYWSSAGLHSCRSHQFPRCTVAGNPNGPGKQKWRP